MKCRYPWFNSAVSRAMVNFLLSLLDTARGGQLAQVTIPLQPYKPLPLSQHEDFLALLVAISVGWWLVPRQEKLFTVYLAGQVKRDIRRDGVRWFSCASVTVSSAHSRKQ